MKEKVKKEKKLRTPIQLNLKVNIGIIVARPVKSDCVTVQNMIYFPSGTTTTCALLQ